MPGFGLSVDWSLMHTRCTIYICRTDWSKPAHSGPLRLQMIKLMNPFKSYWSQTKSVTTRNTMTPQTDTWFLCVDYGTQKAGTFIWGRGNNATNIYNGVFATIKNYLLSLYRVRVLKPFRISHIKLGPLSWKNLTLSHMNNKGADQSAHTASLMRAFVTCSLESI